MTETIEKLKSTLAELEVELQALENVDDETREVLEQAALEIAAAIERAEPGESAPESLLDHLRAATVQFEESYPTLTGILTRLVDGLGQMGI
jgi:chromosome segregation ATPase